MPEKIRYVWCWTCQCRGWTTYPGEDPERCEDCHGRGVLTEQDRERQFIRNRNHPEKKGLD